MNYVVTQLADLGGGVREVRLRPADGSALPAWQAGAHVQLHLPASAAAEDVVRHYSLLDAPGAGAARGERGELRIAVQLEADGRGGSRYVHEQLQAGDVLPVEGPFDSFSLAPGTGRTVLVAGGIGVTPMLAMASQLAAQGDWYEFHYIARSRERMVLLGEIEALPTGTLTSHVTSEQGRPDLEALLGRHSAGAVLYACGPVALLQALAAAAAAQGWPRSALHFESFGARAEQDDQPLTVHLAQSDVTLEVAPGTSILDSLIDAGMFVSYECKRGECGHCHTPVLEGEPLHRDVCLTPQQRAQGMTTCVSWARGGRLVLDM
jgi:vanillate O-demethylase ferredoxin subunit